MKQSTLTCIPCRDRWSSGGPAEELPEEFDQELQSWDLAFKDLETSDYVAGGVRGRKGADRYLRAIARFLPRFATRTIQAHRRSW